ncbi:hypothetical protein [Hymenobacter sp. DG01]|uniref:hypothetical protein n=1 Tax=Hymenobacter sp. DG01 TaxID=2584940 RepID=UPI00111E6ECF|nr:hypothetical protein [Hymenobacter sp. DG01]
MVLLAAYPFVSFYLHDIGCCTIEAVWGEDTNDIFFREAVLQGLMFIRQHKVESWIADDRRLGPMEPHVLEWVAEEVLPAMAASGLRRLAMVESGDWLNRDLIKEAYMPPVENLSIEIRHFADVSSARAWARSK